ncbi:hypothetical protein UFOVP139_47 [uncultured Caudovirales phage]|uniref:Uncharacterized protein n=1 Tax=uncultured Caudovirales phage TaxID=2100421 RepID=A0A6J5LF35_9CAUD|nr:hypothetical protein UFOVP139_47 [uncultured Caudovirales phage]
MSQAELIINPAVDTGADLSDKLNAWRDAMLSTHMGMNRPDYAVPGTFWMAPVTDIQWHWYMFDGMQDILIARFNINNSNLIVTGASTVSVTDVPPENPTPGDMWFENDTGRLYVNYMNPEDKLQTWVATNRPTGKPPNSARAAIDDKPPVDPVKGDLWYEADTGNLYICYENPYDLKRTWVSATAPLISNAKAAQAAQEQAIKSASMESRITVLEKQLQIALDKLASKA